MPLPIAEHITDKDILAPQPAARSDFSFEVENPATGEILGSIPNMGRTETQAAIDRASAALKGWRNLGAYARGEILQCWAAALRDNKEDLARIMTLEQGKPLREARDEVDYALSFFRWFAEEGKRQYGETIPSHKPNSRLMTVMQPIGVTAAITPWNWPLAMITRKAGAALAAGCSMVVKPANETPFTAIALLNLARRAGVPDGVFELVVGDPEAISGAIMDSHDVRAVSFTGSTRVGKILLAQSAKTVKRMALELGGHAPFIVCADADFDAAIKAAMELKYEATGQNCIGINNGLIHESLYGHFCEKVVEESRKVKVGSGLDETVHMGPLMSRAAVEKCHHHVQDAVAKGARLLLGGHPIDGPGHFYAPTILADITSEMEIGCEETFGPVMPLRSFKTIDEAIDLSNRTHYGLGAYVYTHDIRTIWRCIDDIETGMIGVNAYSMTGGPIPFGGIKESGLGREGAKLGLADFTEVKYACMGGLPYSE